MFHRKAYPLLIGCFWFILSGVIAQDQKIADSLAVIYQQDTVTGTARFDLLSELSFNETRDLKKGLRYAEELIALSERTANKSYLRIGYFLKGTKERMLGHVDTAVASYYNSIKIAKEIRHLKGEGEAYGALGDTYTIAGNYPNAMDYYNRAIVILRQLKGDSTSLASVLLNAGDTYFKIKNYDSALLYSKEAKVIFDKVGYDIGKGYSLGNMGMVYASIGQNDLAERNINEAIHILEQAQDYYPICVYLLSMADVYMDKKDDRTALGYALRSLRLAEQHQMKEQVASASLKLSELYDSSGNTSAAFQHYKKYIVYRDSISNLKTVQEMANQRTDFEVSQKQREVNLLKREKENQQTIVFFLFIILGLAVMLLGSVYWFYQTKSREKKRLHHQELLRARLEIQEQTYRNISQELHDNIGQALSLVKLNINTIDINDAAIAREKLSESKDLLTKVIQDLRDISKTLNTDFIHEIGLSNAVDQQLQLMQRTGLFTTKLFVTGDPNDYGSQRELLIFRIVQELLNNIVKHAEANQVVVAMNYEPEKLIITVKDNGKGFDMQKQQFSASKGLGLRNIQNRVKLIKGTIYFESGPDKGTTVAIEILK